MSRASTLRIALALAALLPTALHAQRTDPVRSAPGTAGSLFFVSASLGVGSRDIAGQLSASVGLPSGELIVRLVETSDFNILSPSGSSRDIALLYGVRRRSDRSWGRVAAGPGVVRVVQPGRAYNCGWIFCDYEMNEARTVGLALQADGFWAPAEALGLGVTVSGNLNPERSFAALTFGLALGKVR